MPSGIRSVSPWMTSILSIGMPSSAVTIIANAVLCPWPWAELPV